MSVKRLLCAVALAGLVAVAAQAARPFEEVIPEDALGFVLVRDVRGLGEEMKEHASWQLFTNPSMEPFYAAAKERLNAELAEAEAKAGVTVEEVKSLFQGQIGLYVTMDVAPDAGPGPDMDGAVVFMMETGNRGDQATQVARAILTAANEEKMAEGNPGLTMLDQTYRGASFVEVLLPEQQEPSACFGSDGDVFVFANKREGFEEVMDFLADGAPEPISGLPAYQLALQRISPESDVIGFANLAGLFDTLADADATGEARRIINGLGVDGLISASMGMEVTPETSFSRMFLNIAPPARGIPKMLMTDAISLPSGENIPENATSFTAFSFRLAENWDEFVRIMDTVQPGSMEQFEMQMRQMEEQTGQPMDLRNDILSVFGPRFIMYQVIEKPYNLMTSKSTVFMVEIPGQAEFDAALNKLSLFFPVRQLMAPEEYMGYQVFTQQRPPNAPPLPDNQKQPCFVATERYLIFSDTPNALKAHLRRQGADEPSLADREDYQAAMGALPPGDRVLISFTDPTPQMEMLLTSLREGQFNMILGMMMRNNPQAQEILNLFDFSKLPQNEEITPYMVPNGACVLRLADGLLMVGQAPAQPLTGPGAAVEGQ